MEVLHFCDEWPFVRTIRALAHGHTSLEKKNVLAFVPESPLAVQLPFFFLLCA